MEVSHRASYAEMRTIEVAQEIPATEMEAFLAGVIGTTADETLQNIGVEFLLRRNHLEESLAAEAPLSAFIPMSIIDGDRVVAEVGSIDDDPMGRLVHHARQHIAFTIPWLARALQRARDRHNLTGRQVAGWANRAGLFGDGRLVTDGVDAWLAGDHRKAAHILIPQIEAGVRTFIGRCGRPTTKPHPQMRRARMVFTMGELLFHPETTTALGPIGPHLILHLRTLYTDPRGLNWRNDLAHGLINADSMDGEMSLWLIHTLLLLGGVMRFGQPASEPADESGTEAAPA